MITSKISPSMAGKLLNQSTEFVRIGLIQQRLPVGTAVKMSINYVYDIRPNMLAEYMGIPQDELGRRIKLLKGA